ncbi:MAG: lipoyl(octanoyl) transferase LipB [Actinomycetota bacterium]
MGLLTRALDVQALGTVSYADAHALQTSLHERRVGGEIDDTLLLLEHPHVYTIGRRGTADDVLWDADVLRARGVAVVETDRGGQVTYHGPGQLVGYPIVDLGPAADLVGYVRRLEDVMIGALARLGVVGAERDAAKNTGVWVRSAKIGAIGVRVTRNVTKHGFALNVAPDLSYFAGIVPCGITDRGVTSIAMEIDRVLPVSEVAVIVADEFANVFGYPR